MNSIQQISVFVENETGKLAELTRLKALYALKGGSSMQDGWKHLAEVLLKRVK